MYFKDVGAEAPWVHGLLLFFSDVYYYCPTTMWISGKFDTNSVHCIGIEALFLIIHLSMGLEPFPASNGYEEYQIINHKGLTIF